MEKIIKVGNKSVKLNNSVAWAMEYRDQFGKDVIQDHVPMFATVIETMATVVGESDGNVSIADVLSSLEGRTLDIMMPMMTTEVMTVVINVMWAMAKVADEDIDPPKEWVKQFDNFPLDVIIPAVYELALKGFISSKNLKRLKTMKKNLQPLISTPSSSQESNED